jgi:hypothetical protein
MVNNEPEGNHVSTTSADAHRAALTARPRTPPGAAYWLLTVFVMPVLGTIAVLELYQPFSRVMDSTAALWVAVALAVAATTALMAQLPRLRAMSRRRRAAWCAGSAVLQVALGFGATIGLLMWAFSGCTNGC